MDILFRILLVVHIAGGTAGLVFSMVTLAVAKGTRTHTLLGRFFAYGMVAAGVSSFGLAIIHPNLFLGVVGVFSLYLALSGMRALAWRGLDAGLSTFKDALLQGGMTLGSMGMFTYAGYMVATGGNTQLAIVLVVFGLIGLQQVRIDFNIVYRGKRPPQFWLRAHIQKMLAATISAYTAFFVVNGTHWTFVQPIVLWLGPTVVGTLGIAYWMRRVEKKTALS